MYSLMSTEQIHWKYFVDDNNNNNLYFIKNWYIIMKMYNLSMKTKTQIQKKKILDSSLDWTNQILDIKAHKSFSKTFVTPYLLNQRL